MFDKIINKITNKLHRMSTRKFWAIFGSIIFILLVIETLLIASLIEGLYLNEVNNQMYDYGYTSYDLEVNTTFRAPMIAQDDYWVIRKIEGTVNVCPHPLTLDSIIFHINISMNILIIEGSITITNFTFAHQETQFDKVIIDYTFSKINTTTNELDMRTTTIFLLSVKTSDIAKSLGVVKPFWVA